MVRIRTIKTKELGYDEFSSMPVIDVETIDLYGRPSVVGILYKDEIKQIILHKMSSRERFKEVIVQELNKLPQPFLAFNKNFDKRVIAKFTGQEYDFKEIQEHAYQKKQKAKLKYGIKVADPFEGNGSLAMFYYKQFMETRNEADLQKVVNHNTACLLIESMLWKKRKTEFDLEPEVDQLMRDYYLLKVKLRALQEQEEKVKKELSEYMEKEGKAALENKFIFLKFIESERVFYPKKLIEQEVPGEILEKIKQVKKIRSLISGMKNEK